MDNLSVNIKIESNPYLIPLENVFSMAARNNPKRGYLFVSKLIGKHIPVHPQVPFLTGYLLASRLAERLGLNISRELIDKSVNMLTLQTNFDSSFKSIYEFPGKALFLGFAETATALGHSVFDCFLGKIKYIHTTRENLAGSYDTIFFSEDHCHAPEQRCLVLEPDLFIDNDYLVIIDDEISTGNLCLNLIRAIQGKYPHKHYVILSILDWRSAEAKHKYAQVEEELGVKITVLSLISGSFTSYGTAPVEPEPLSCAESAGLPVKQYLEPMGREVRFPGHKDICYLHYTGRFGIDVGDSSRLKVEAGKLGKKLAAARKGQKTLCLGTGEFMYIPFLIASYMGEGVWVQSTTRSPVHPREYPDYAVKHAINFYDPFRPHIRNFVYNIPPNYYDEVYIFWERKVTPEQVHPLVAALNKLGISNINFVSHCS